MASLILFYLGAREAAGTSQLLVKSSADEREAESDSEPEEKEKEEVEEIGEITTTTVEEGELVDRRGVEGKELNHNFMNFFIMIKGKRNWQFIDFQSVTINLFKDKNLQCYFLFPF